MYTAHERRTAPTLLLQRWRYVAAIAVIVLKRWGGWGIGNVFVCACSAAVCALWLCMRVYAGGWAGGQAASVVACTWAEGCSAGAVASSLAGCGYAMRKLLAVVVCACVPVSCNTC